MNGSIEKHEIIDSLNILLSFNVIGSMQYRNRYNGFVGELDFQEWFKLHKPGNKVFSGGFFLPSDGGASPLKSPIYFTVSKDDVSSYVEIYKAISKLDCKRLFFIQWREGIPFSEWEKKDIMGISKPLPIPDFEVYIFDLSTYQFTPSSLDALLDLYTDCRWIPRDQVDKPLKEFFSNELDRFDEQFILDLYVQRLIFDGFIGFKKIRGIPSDIDVIIKSENTDLFVFLEVKEKDLSKRPPKGFGMDVERIAFFYDLMKTVGLDAFYIVRQINNQKDRAFIDWRIVPMKKFIDKVGGNIIEGGTGMRSASSFNPTKICPEIYFSRF